MFVQRFLVQLLLEMVRALQMKDGSGGPLFKFFPFFLGFFPPKRKKNASGLTHNFKQNQIDHPYAVASMNLVSCVTKSQQQTPSACWRSRQVTTETKSHSLGLGKHEGSFSTFCAFVLLKFLLWYWINFPLLNWRIYKEFCSRSKFISGAIVWNFTEFLGAVDGLGKFSYS